MKIVSAVSEYGGGHAWLHIGSPPTDDMRLIVEREGERNCFLGPQGWQSLPQEASPIPVAEPSQKNALLLGPEIVDHLRDGDYVTISIPSTGFSISDFWPPIPISGRKGQGFGMVGQASTIAPSPAKAPPKNTVTTAAIAAPEINEDATGDASSFPVSQGRKRVVWVAAAAAGLLACLTLGYFAWTYLPEDPLTALTDGVRDAVSDIGAGIGEMRDGITAQIPGFSARDTAYWTGVLKDPATTPEQLYSSALETREGSETRGVSHELLFQSALRGNNQALRDYSRLYDPTVTEPSGWEGRKNARTALEFYSKLRDDGDQDAVARISRVCDFLKPDIYVNADTRTAFDDYCSHL